MYRRALFSCCLLLLAMGGTGCISLDLMGTVSASLQEDEISRDGYFVSDKILLVDISGLIRSGEGSGFFTRYTTPDSIKAVLNKALLDEDIKAVVLRINSPGGEVTATDIIHHDILSFKEETGIPVYAAIMSVGTSGAYYIGASADKIFSHPTSVLGSIGVIARVPQYGELANKIGYSEVIFKSGKNKDLGDPLRELTAEQQVIFQDMIDSMHERFLGIVVQGRPGFETREDLRSIADGRIYTPEEALRLKLIDDIAYLEEVIEKVKVSAGLESASVITYSHHAGYDSNIYSKLPTQMNLLNIDLDNVFGGFGGSQAGFHYLWMPAH
jgi:protease-4